MCVCVEEMGERSTVQQHKQPPYDGGLCNYAQKIGSCFGLDGKREGGLSCTMWRRVRRNRPVTEDL